MNTQSSGFDSLPHVKRNEDLSIEFDVEDFLTNAHPLIKYVEYKRIKYAVELAGKNNGVILDVGCGSGYILERLSADHKYGIDLSLNNITKAKKNLAGKKNIFLERADAQNLPFNDSFFDCVVSSEVIEHVPNPEKVLAEIFRVLKADGRMVITVPNDHIVNACKNIFRRLGLTKLLNLRYGGAEVYHLHIFTGRQFLGLLKKHNFRVLKKKVSPFFFLQLRSIYLCEKK
jgi:ubiquinone/menaquinone biosynthesis C-methylase UbiE